tara:strand:- start:551 stop:1045 length:495 start_codon:yes stop_codon:yes gene_type:complete
MSDNAPVEIVARYGAKTGTFADIVRTYADVLHEDVGDAVKEAVIRATVRAFNRAKETKLGAKRTWMTEARRKGGATSKSDLGRTSADGYVPVDTGNLWRSIRKSIRGLRSNIGFNTRGLVFSDVKYAPFQEGKRGFFAAAEKVAEDEFEKVFRDAIRRANNRTK